MEKREILECLDETAAEIKQLEEDVGLLEAEVRNRRRMVLDACDTRDKLKAMLEKYHD